MTKTLPEEGSLDCLVQFQCEPSCRDLVMEFAEFQLQLVDELVKPLCP